MIDDSFEKVYGKFRLHFYKNMFGKIQSGELALSTLETFCIEIIYALDHPTVTEFANYVQISSPNAAYKVNSLIKKGFLRKIQSQNDKREYHLEVTDKYMKYYNVSRTYMKLVSERIDERFSEEELEVLDRVFRITCDELMPEVFSDGDKGEA